MAHPQETLEDIDKNGDGYVDEDEYIGELISLVAYICCVFSTYFQIR